jgi:uncharacterized alpha-E superfamily protein
MLSRIAESLFWMARYMERAEDTARLLDVHYHMLLEHSPQSYQLRWEAIIAISGETDRFFKVYHEATPHNVFEFLGFRDDNPNSVLTCINHVRENARTIRDRISREMWEDINSLYHRLRGFRPETEIAVGPHRFCNEIKFGSFRFHGVTDDTLPHDEGWQFLKAGRSLERAETTAHIVDAEYHQLLTSPSSEADVNNHQWMAVLRSVAAYEIYRREYHASNRKRSPNCSCFMRAIHDPSASISPHCTRLCRPSADRVRTATPRKPSASPARCTRACSTTASKTCSHAACIRSSRISKRPAVLSGSRLPGVISTMRWSPE